jgi:hypothetical protein
MTNWASVAARLYTFLIVPVASGLVAGALFVLSLSPAAVKQIAHAAGALSMFVPLFTVLAAAIGWFVAAALNGREARRTESAKQEHARQGTRRQIRTLLRDALATIDPFFYLFKRTQFEDVIRTYERFVDRLNERETAIALEDAEYDAVDTFVATLGRKIALARRHAAEAASAASEDSPRAFSKSVRAEIDKAYRYAQDRAFYAECFGDILPSLKAALHWLGDNEMRYECELMAKRSESTKSLLYRQLLPEPIATDIKISTKLDKLGDLQHPIEEAVKAEFPGSNAGFVPLPNGLAALMVTWKDFDGYDLSKRQEMVRDAIAKVGPNAPQLISVILPVTPDETLPDSFTYP